MPLGKPFLLSECAEISDGDLQPCFPMYDSENFQISQHGKDEKIVVIFQPYTPSDFCGFACDF